MGLAYEQIQSLRRFDTALEGAASALDDALFAFAYGLHIDRSRASVYAVVSATPCQIGDACAGDHRFCGSTAYVDTGTAQVAALNERHFPACLGECDWEESATLTGTDNNRIIVCGLWHPKVLLLLLHKSILLTASKK